MKVKVLYPSAFADLDPQPVGSDIIDLPTERAEAVVAAGYAEMAGKVERATKAPGEKSNASRPKKSA